MAIVIDRIPIFDINDTEVYLLELGTLVGVLENNVLNYYKYVSNEGIDATTTFADAITSDKLKPINFKRYKSVNYSATDNDIFVFDDYDNVDLNKHIFVLKTIPPENNVQKVIYTFNTNQTKFTFDPDWVELNDEGIRLYTQKDLTTNEYTNTNNVRIFKVPFDLTKIDNLLSVKVIPVR